MTDQQTIAPPGSASHAEPGGALDAAVRTRGLTKRFSGGQLAVDHVDLLVPPGSVYGFLGPNGSGKTTTIRMLLGLISPTAGDHSLFCRPMPAAAGEVLPRVGALVEGPAFHLHLSGTANLARLDAADRTANPATAKQRIGEAIDRVGLTAAGSKKVRAYSLGMKQRLGIAAALLRPRDLLVLDEPTNGLDPQGTREIRSLIASLAQGGATVLVSSHLLSEIEQVCSHIGIMHVGKLVAQGSMEQLQASRQGRVRVHTRDAGLAAELLRGLGSADVTTVAGGVSAALGDVAPENVCAALVTGGVAVRGFAVHAPTLEDMFVSLTGEGFDVSA